jgi:hypothetical protein
VKFDLNDKKKFGLYKIKSHVHWKTEEFNHGTFLLNDSVTKTHSLCYNGHFLKRISDMGMKN